MAEGKIVIDREHLKNLLVKEEQLFDELHPKSKALFNKAKETVFQGVPMLWMVRSAGRFPLFVKEGSGQYFTDVDGVKYLDLCLGDTGAMTGHAPAISTDIIVDVIILDNLLIYYECLDLFIQFQQRIKKGITFMLPCEDTIWVGQELKRRFGLPYWQFALTATDCNRNVIRLARHITKRPKILVYNWCYHGTVIIFQ